MLRRELAIVLGARVTWLVVAVAALLGGHSFVLAIDLFTAGARSVEAGGLMAREFDPLLGIIRPTLGGIYIAASLLFPLVAARSLGIEQERRSLRVLLLQTAAPLRLLLAKYLATLAASALLLGTMIAMAMLWLGIGGHLDAAEVVVALIGHALHLAFIAAVACAAAAWTRTVAQATAITLLSVLGSWGIDAAEGFAALAWLGSAAEWSITAHLHSFEHGILSVGDSAWFLAATGGALALALVGLRFDWPAYRRALGVCAVLLFTLLWMKAAGRQPRAYDCTQARRVSFPVAAVTALRTLQPPISLTVNLDRDDARRRQLDLDVLSKLRLARPDVQVRYPLDDRVASTEATRDEGYGRIEVCAGALCKQTYSGSRKELVTLLFECAGQPLPDWTQPNYPGYPLVVEGRRRTVVLWLSYLILPLALSITGLWVTRRRRRK